MDITHSLELHVTGEEIKFNILKSTSCLKCVLHYNLQYFTKSVLLTPITCLNLICHPDCVQHVCKIILMEQKHA